MSDDVIIDHGHQHAINRVFALFLVLAIVGAALAKNYWFSTLTNIDLYIIVFFPVALLFISFGFGYASKKAIDYIPGEWERRKVFVTFSEYERMVEDYDDAYGELYSHPGDCMTFCCLLPVIFVFGYMFLIFQGQGIQLISPLVDTLLLLGIYYSIVGAVGFITGFRIPSIDAEEFFKAPPDDDSMEYAEKLDGVRGLEVGVAVELGVRAGVQTLFNAEPKVGVKGLPDTVRIRIQVSHSGFDYPYLVGTVYKGAPVEETVETIKIRTRYRALLEYSMDENVTVIVARFKVPKRSSRVPYISDEDFRALARLLAEKLKENYESAQ
ncbi:MAG: hypothetical protein ACP6KW_00790 [Candidatus Thorarchaeota archaeon]